MPLIKDKYSKSSKERSRYVVDRRVVKLPDVQPFRKTTEQKISESAKAIRDEKVITTATTGANTISGKILSTVGVVENILTLEAGSTLKNMIISHYDADETNALLSLYWSFISSENLTFAVTGGAIDETTGGKVFRLFSSNFENYSAISFSESGLLNSFEKVSVPIYFYAVCNFLGPTFTIIKSYG